MAEELNELSLEYAGPVLAKAIQAMNGVILSARKYKLTKSQYVMFLLADMMTWVEVGDTLCRKAAYYKGGQARSPEFMNAAARLFAREAVEKILSNVREAVEKILFNGLKIAHGCGETIDEMVGELDGIDMAKAMKDNMKDMDLIAAELVK
jgi:hypothetical protein